MSLLVLCCSEWLVSLQLESREMEVRVLTQQLEQAKRDKASMELEFASYRKPTQAGSYMWCRITHRHVQLYSYCLISYMCVCARGCVGVYDYKQLLLRKTV